MTDKPIQINIDEIIRSKNPKLLKQIPRFILNWFKRFVYQDYINEILRKGHGTEGKEFVDVVFNELKINIICHGLEHIPKTGGCILAANHPLGGIDGMALLKGASEIRDDLIFLANDILMNIKPLSPYFIAVNKVGKSDRNNLAQITQAYSSGKCVLIFPSGYVSRKIDGHITDLDWQKSVVVKSRQNQIPIVPVFIDGRNTERFYRISAIRKVFGIKINFEMFTLPDEMFKARGKDIHIYFGKPIPTEKLSQGNPFEVAQKIKKLVYLLKGNLLTEY